jgi:putative ABC transport system permease protein
MTSIRPDPRAMRAADLLGLAFSALAQQKVRTILTIIGVVIGTFALVLSLSIGTGVDRAIVALFREDDRLRKIDVRENYETTAQEVPAAEREPKGVMSDAKRERIRSALVRNWVSTHGRPKRLALTSDAVARLRAIPHVEQVEPMSEFHGKATMDGKEYLAGAASISVNEGNVGPRLLAGRLFTPQDRRAAIVHEYLLYRLGLVGDQEAVTALGRTLHLEYESSPQGVLDLASFLSRGKDALSGQEIRALQPALKRLALLARLLPGPQADRDVLHKLFERFTITTKTTPIHTYSEQFTIVGIVREQHDKDEKPGWFGAWYAQTAEILLPTQAAAEFYVRDPDQRERGFNQIVVTVDQEEHVKEVTLRIKDLGFREFSLVEFISTVRLNVMLISFTTAFVAIVALVVAAVGITNTMIMSVLERTHEIGVMKALGARDRHILLMFVVEGAVIGAVGSGLGLVLGWLASFPGDAIAQSLIESQHEIPLKGTLFAFPAWLVAGVPLSVCVFTILAALYPAIRAARVDPVTSLRHE